MTEIFLKQVEIKLYLNPKDLQNKNTGFYLLREKAFG